MPVSQLSERGKMEEEKFIDESWKESVEQEKDRNKRIIQPVGRGDVPGEKDQTAAAPGEKSPDAHPSFEEPQASGKESLEETGDGVNDAGGIPDVNFISYVTSLAFQAVIFLGEMPNPLTNELEKNYPQAKFLIDTLALLKEKTEGNLSQEENETLTNMLYELQMKYVEVIKGEKLS